MVGTMSSGGEERRAEGRRGEGRGAPSPVVPPLIFQSRVGATSEPFWSYLRFMSGLVQRRIARPYYDQINSAALSERLLGERS